MNKKVALISTVVVVQIVFLCTIFFLIIFSEPSPSEWFRDTYQDGNCVIVAQQINDRTKFTSTDVNIHLFYEKKEVVSFSTDIESNGTKLTEDNYKIEYNGNYIKIYLINYDKTMQIYIFNLDDYTK